MREKTAYVLSHISLVSWNNAIFLENMFMSVYSGIFESWNLCKEREAFITKLVTPQVLFCFVLNILLIFQQEIVNCVFRGREIFFFNFWLLQWNFTKFLRVLTLLNWNNCSSKILHKNCHYGSETKLTLLKTI